MVVWTGKRYCHVDKNYDDDDDDVDNDDGQMSMWTATLRLCIFGLYRRYKIWIIIIIFFAHWYFIPRGLEINKV